jgi:hypothetical protein
MPLIYTCPEPPLMAGQSQALAMSGKAEEDFIKMYHSLLKCVHPI